MPLGLRMPAAKRPGLPSSRRMVEIPARPFSTSMPFSATLEAEPTAMYSVSPSGSMVRLRIQ
jgi:hypothetical protein